MHRGELRGYVGVPLMWHLLTFSRTCVTTHFLLTGLVLYMMGSVFFTTCTYSLTHVLPAWRCWCTA
jgi:predicted membrane channel-forming protein YqfA (hemolysin III family)